MSPSNRGLVRLVLSQKTRVRIPLEVPIMLRQLSWLEQRTENPCVICSIQIRSTIYALLAELAYAAASRAASIWVRVPGKAPVISGSSVAVASVFWAHVVKVQLLRLGPYIPLQQNWHMRLAKDQGLFVGSSPTQGTNLYPGVAEQADATSLSLVQLWVQLPLPGPWRKFEIFSNFLYNINID